MRVKPAKGLLKKALAGKAYAGFFQNASARHTGGPEHQAPLWDHRAPAARRQAVRIVDLGRRFPNPLPREERRPRRLRSLENRGDWTTESSCSPRNRFGLNGRSLNGAHTRRQPKTTPSQLNARRNVWHGSRTCDKLSISPMAWPVLLMARALDAGGSERQLTETAKALDRSRFEPHVGTFNPRGMRGEELGRAGIPVAEFPIYSY